MQLKNKHLKSPMKTTQAAEVGDGELSEEGAEEEAEWKNRTIMNMVRCLLTEKHMPKTFWAEAAQWTVHVLNRSPTSAVKGKTPEECRSGIKPNVEHFRVFGCIGHVHIPDRKRLKLDDKIYKCVLLGVSNESKAYRLFDPIAKVVVTSRDVVFEENESWNWGRSNDEVKFDSGDINHEFSDIGETEHFEEEQEDEASASSDSNEGSESISPEVNNLHSNRERIRSASIWMQDYVTGEELSEEENVQDLAFFMSQDPIYYEEAAKSDKWKNAMDLEIEAIEKNDTWGLVSLPHGAKKLSVKWVYKTKLNESGEIDKYKARLVVKGYAQKYRVDYNEVFAPVARCDTIRVVLALAAQKGMDSVSVGCKECILAR